MYNQRNLVQDYIFPLQEVLLESHGMEFKKFLGTAFLIGNNGYALTAAHVVEKALNPIAGTFVGEDNNWYGYLINPIEYHPEQDIAIIKLNGGNWKSPFVLSKERHFGGKDYLLYGYPEAVLFEDTCSMDHIGRILPKPDLVNTKGFIKRRITRELDISNVKGNTFYELSHISGLGCSGSPLFVPLPSGAWDVIAIYVAEKTFYKDGEDQKYIDREFGYAVTSDCIYDWAPKCLGKSVYEESLNFIP